MNYKTILVHIDDDKELDQRANIAAQITQSHHAHLIGLAVTGVSRYFFSGDDPSIVAPYYAQYADALQTRAQLAIARFEKNMVGQTELSYEIQFAQDEICGGMGLRARYADLIIIGQTNPNLASLATASDFPESIILQSGRPVLLIPHSRSVTRFGKNAVVAWDGSREAARAALDALPLLKKCTTVHLLIINPNEQAETHGEEPGADFALFLARHDIKVEIEIRYTQTIIGNAILQACQELSADLLVMGAYGHSRFREMLMGGVSKTILTKMNLPVLMAH